MYKNIFKNVTSYKIQAKLFMKALEIIKKKWKQKWDDMNVSH